MVGLKICIKLFRHIFRNEVNDTLRKVMSEIFGVDRDFGIILHAKNERKRAEIQESSRGLPPLLGFSLY